MTLELLKPFGVLIRAEKSRLTQEISPDRIQNLLREHKLIVLRGFESFQREEFLSFCESFPGMETLNWASGPVMEMKESQDPQNYLFSREEVPFHWDGAFHRVPNYLVFSCVQAPIAGAGGETLFTDTEKIYADGSVEERALWGKLSLSYETEKLAHYGGKIEGPLVQTHPQSGRKILRFAEPVKTKLNPVHMETLGLPVQESARVVQDLAKRIYDDRNCYRHVWQEGDILFADNHSLIHGRTAFEKNCPRHLRRIQLIETRS